MAAPSGGGGGGGPVGFAGSTFTGPAQAVEIVGDHAYACSGLVPTDNSETHLINTTTGNYYWTVKVMFSYAVEGVQGDNYIYRIKFNGNVIWLHQVNNSTAELQQPYVIHLVVPPYTVVEFTSRCDEDTANELITAIFTGKLYQ